MNIQSTELAGTNQTMLLNAGGVAWQYFYFIRS